MVCVSMVSITLLKISVSLSVSDGGLCKNMSLQCHPRLTNELTADWMLSACWGCCIWHWSVNCGLSLRDNSQSLVVLLSGTELHSSYGQYQSVWSNHQAPNPTLSFKGTLGGAVSDLPSLIRDTFLLIWFNILLKFGPPQSRHLEAAHKINCADIYYLLLVREKHFHLEPL